MALNLSFPDSIYTEANKPVAATLKADLAAIETEVNTKVKATGAEINTGTNDTKFATPKALADSVYYGVPNAIQRQGIINGGMVVNQRAAVFALSGTGQYVVDRMIGLAGGTVTAGSIGQATTGQAGSSGYIMYFSGVTITGSGTIIQKYRMEAKDAVQFKNQIASFSAKVYHDVGSAINYIITVRTPTTTADVFSAVTDISNSGNISVANATSTEIKYENIWVGDCSKGIEIEVKAVCGAITTKNFQFAEFQFNKGAVALPFVCGTFEEELTACMRYYEKSHDYGITPGVGAGLEFGAELAVATTNSSIETFSRNYKVSKRIVPTVALYSYTPTLGKVSQYNGTDDVAGTLSVVRVSENVFRQITSTLTPFTAGAYYWFHWTVSAEL